MIQIFENFGLPEHFIKAAIETFDMGISLWLIKRDKNKLNTKI